MEVSQVLSSLTGVEEANVYGVQALLVQNARSPIRIAPYFIYSDST